MPFFSRRHRYTICGHQASPSTSLRLQDSRNTSHTSSVVLDVGALHVRGPSLRSSCAVPGRDVPAGTGRSACTRRHGKVTNASLVCKARTLSRAGSEVLEVRGVASCTERMQAIGELRRFRKELESHFVPQFRSCLFYGGPLRATLSLRLCLRSDRVSDVRYARVRRVSLWDPLRQ